MAVSDFHRSIVKAAASGKTPKFRSTSPSTDDVGAVTKKRSTPTSTKRPSLLNRKLETVTPAKKVVTTGSDIAPKKSIRPKLDRRNAYNAKTGRRNNPTLIQRILDTSVLYNFGSYLGRRFDPRG